MAIFITLSMLATVTALIAKTLWAGEVFKSRLALIMSILLSVQVLGLTHDGLRGAHGLFHYLQCIYQLVVLKILVTW